VFIGPQGKEKKKMKRTTPWRITAPPPNKTTNTHTEKDADKMERKMKNT
jgi:hypothetical protein